MLTKKWGKPKITVGFRRKILSETSIRIIWNLYFKYSSRKYRRNRRRNETQPVKRLQLNKLTRSEQDHTSCLVVWISPLYSAVHCSAQRKSFLRFSAFLWTWKEERCFVSVLAGNKDLVSGVRPAEWFSIFLSLKARNVYCGGWYIFFLTWRGVPVVVVGTNR